jgi:predicted nuclease of predicted toxin-antitoxin system
LKFLIDQDVYALTARHLASPGHDVVTAAERGHSCAADSFLLQLAATESRILITRDRDYGELVFVQRAATGVIYLRVVPSTLHSVHNELDRILAAYSEAELRAAFVVVEPGRHRIRRFSKE